MTPSSYTIIGIDPGFARTGYGAIQKTKNEYRCIPYGCITTSPTSAFPNRLHTLYTNLSALFSSLKPTIISLEKIFFAKNTKTALDVSAARGVIMLCAYTHGISIQEFTPLQVKQGVIGYGKADKLQVQKIVQILLKLPSLPKPDDAADALALALCANTTILNPK